MKILSIAADNRRKAFVLRTRKGSYEFPYARLQLPPSPADRLAEVHVDDELGQEAFTYTLESGREGTVHVDQVLDYNRDAGYLADLLLYKLTLEAEKRFQGSGIGVRQLARRLGTSPSQIYRLLDPTHYKKSVRQMLALLHALDCEVDLVVRDRKAS